MKKIIWLFGQPGSGKKTLLNNIVNKNEDVLNTFDMNDKVIRVLELPFDREYYVTNFKSIDTRRTDILNAVKSFSLDMNDVLVIYGEHEDFVDYSYSMMKHIAEEYPRIEKEILYLIPSDLKVLHQRLQDAEWYKKDIKTNSYRYQYSWLLFSVDYYRKFLSRYEEFGYKYIEVDTLDGYKIDKPKTLTLKQDN